MELEIQKLFAELELYVTKGFNQCLLHIRNAKDATLAKQKYSLNQSTKSCKCIAIIKTGQNKGSKCNRKVKQDSEYCGYHISKVARTSVALLQHYLLTDDELQSVINTNYQNMQEQGLSNDKWDDITNLSSDKPVAEHNIPLCPKLGLGDIISSLKNPSSEKNFPTVDKPGSEKNFPMTKEPTLVNNTLSTKEPTLANNTLSTKEPTLTNNTLPTNDKPIYEKSLYITCKPTLSPDETLFSSDESTLGKGSFVYGELSHRETTIDHLDKAITEIGEMYYNSDGVISVVKDTIIPYTWRTFRKAIKRHCNI